MKAQPQFVFGDSDTFEQNIGAFALRLAALDAQMGPALSAALTSLADGAEDKPRLLDALFGVLDAPLVASDEAGALTPVAVLPALPPVAAPTRWFLEAVEIEGIRGINNEGAPLKLKFNPDGVSSISAPNGVGKSSIYEALSVAITGKIPKLDRLLQAEKPQEYYLNRFHPADSGTVKLVLRPESGGASVPIVVTRTAVGGRTITGPAGVDAEGLLASLNREFVLLDGQTFQNFIDDKALERGRAFSGLLGLSRYSALRQQLQALCQTRAFNSHFDTSGHTQKKATAARSVTTTQGAIATDYEKLVKEPLGATTPAPVAQQCCKAALHGIPVLVDHCASRLFMDVDIDACVTAITTAEGGPKRERLGAVIRSEADWIAANKVVPSQVDLPALASLANMRDDALKLTAGDVLRKLYRLSEQVISAEGWPSPTLCPTCGRNHDTSVLDEVRAKLGQYDAVESATQALAAEWDAKGWGDLLELEKLTTLDGEAPLLRQLATSGEAGTLSAEEAAKLGAYVDNMRGRAANSTMLLKQEREELERQLPPSLVAVTTAVETARRLQVNWSALHNAEVELASEAAWIAQAARVKTFLERASEDFAASESAMASARLKRVEPLCQELFEQIMFSPVVPALEKPEGSEELGIRLAEFWGLNDLSAQALLSESYRNGFAVSVYLAAASLYGGAPHFIILDDVTSSFDAGHQHHLVEVIRTRFARPIQPSGPQVILLSHDTLLEKLFNKHSGSAEWSHQRLEGTARTAVLSQSGAVNKVRDATVDLLNAGRIDDAAPRIRQYLEYTLHVVIDRVHIPVPLDLAFGDDKRTPGEYLKAIEAAVALEDKARTLILDAAQKQALQLHSAVIVGNFLAHWSTGQTQAFSAPALLGVMRAIDDFPECFKYSPIPGAASIFYRSLHHR